MLAEIAAANAAFGILRQAVSNSQDLANFGKAISAVVVGEEALKKKSERESKSIWSKIAGKDAQDMDSFMELEKLRENKKQLESMMRLYGRPGLHADWVKFCAEARKSKRMAEMERKEAIARIKEITAYIVGGVVLIGGIAGLIYMAIAFRDFNVG
jgi:hypothetical protein